ncbi:MAG: hypothetical protein ACI4D9_02235, partial [Lachnospiraceae bacterium]
WDFSICHNNFPAKTVKVRFATRLSTLRKAQGMTQEEMAVCSIIKVLAKNILKPMVKMFSKAIPAFISSRRLSANSDTFWLRKEGLAFTNVNS